MAHGSGDISNVTWLVVKSPGVGLGGKDGNASSSLPVFSSDCAIKMNGEDSQEETPLILGGVPVKLADCSGLNSHLCGADGLAGREGPCVDDLDRATVELGRGSLGQGEDERFIDSAGGADGGLIGFGQWCGENIKLLSGYVGECGRVDLEVLRKDFDGDMGHPVGQEEGRVFAEVANVHDLRVDSMRIRCFDR